jgi:hypothetical protein
MPAIKAYLVEAQAAAMIGMSPKTLKNWRGAGKGPPWASRPAECCIPKLISWIGLSK